jgi:serine/threonine-protein kinase
MLIERQGRPKLNVKLRTAEEIGDGFVYVPGGPFVTGGDPANQAVGPRRVEVVADFAISRYPVTAAQYLEFINAMAKDAPRPASFHVPRRRRDDLLWPTDEDGVYHLPEEDVDGETWTLLRPVTHVSWDDAVAYCKWLSRRTGLLLRLPTSAELEKAGRGVDGRIFPWGTRFSPMFCKMAESRAERSQPEPVGAFGMDESPFGACDVAGCVAEWCDGWYDQARGQRPLRGMGFEGTDFECRLTYERGHRPFAVLPYAGFRLAHSFE